LLGVAMRILVSVKMTILDLVKNMNAFYWMSVLNRTGSF
jgi:hypothetical protein